MNFDFDISQIDPSVIAKFERGRHSPLDFGEEFLCIPEPPYSPFKANFPQRAILTESKRTVWICVHRRAGKCVCGDTLILHPVTKRPVPIRDAAHFNRTLLFDFEANRTVWAPCEWIHSGEKHCLRLTLGTGIDQDLSDDHEVFTRRAGWLKVRDVRVGDEILAPTLLDAHTGDVPTPEEFEIHLDETFATDRFPDAVFGYRDDVLRRYLGRFFQEKGRALHKERQIAFMLWKRPFALDLHHLLLRLGVECRIDRDGNAFIDQEIDLALFLKTIGIDHPVREVRSLRRWERVVAKKGLGVRPVYDLMVDHPDHNFIGNDLVLHNSYSLTLIALWHAICHDDKKVVLFAPSTTQVDEFFNTLHTWIEKNPLLGAMKKTSFKNPHQRIEFKNGSYIAGYILGVNANVEGSRRGITADVVLVDEGQELSDSDWDVIMPIMRGDITRRARMRAYVAGTLKEPAGEFWKKVDITGPKKHSAVIKIPITDNADWTPEMIQEEFEEVNNLGRWQREYLLQVTGRDTAVFDKKYLEEASSRDWEWGPQNIDDRCVRFITVDWDKVQCGTNILVTQYDPDTRKLVAIYHEEVARGEFHYINACNRVLDLVMEYGPELVVTDQGGGMMQYEYLIDQATKRSISTGRFEMLAFNKKLDILDPQSMEVEQKPAKDFLVGRLQKKFQELEIEFPNEGMQSKMREQFYQYHIKRRLASGQNVYTSENEHIVDCWLFACYALWLLYENDFAHYELSGDAGMRITSEELNQNEDQHEAERTFWRNVEGDRTEPDGIVIYRSDFDDPWSRTSWERF